MPLIKPQRQKFFDPFGARRKDGSKVSTLNWGPNLGLSSHAPRDLQPFAGREGRKASDDDLRFAALDRKLEDGVSVLGIEKKDLLDRAFDLFDHGIFIIFDSENAVNAPLPVAQLLMPLHLPSSEGHADLSPSEGESGHGSEKRSFSESSRTRASRFSSPGKICVAKSDLPFAPSSCYLRAVKFLRLLSNSLLGGYVFSLLLAVLFIDLNINLVFRFDTLLKLSLLLMLIYGLLAALLCLVDQLSFIALFQEKEPRSGLFRPPSRRSASRF